MLLKYSVQNYKCFQEKETISFKAKKISEKSNKQYSLLKNDILPIISIYGPNGGGKTSLIESISILKDIVLNGKILDARIINMLKNQNQQTEDIKWEIEFIEPDETIYVYKLNFGEEITFESLYKNKKLIFERNKEKIEFSLADIPNSSIKKENISHKSSILLFLDSLFNNLDIGMVMGEFRKIKYLDTAKDITVNTSIFGAAFLDVGYVEILEKDKDKFLKIFKELDINIINLEFHKNPINPNMINIISVKKNDFGKEFKIHLRAESKGTIKLIHLMTYFIQGLHNQEIFIIDELDSALHTNLLKYIIKLFNSHTFNKGSQLIYTSHDISTLNKENFRRDQIYFCAMNESYFSNVISLKDIGARNDDVFSKQYLEGKYGYDPYIDFSLKAFNEKK